MNIPLIKLSIGEDEARAAYEVVLSGWLTEGEKVRAFESKVAGYVGVKYAVSMFNGTVALHALLMSLGIGPGDEVIVPSFTFISTVTAVLHAGATPVFADIDKQSLNIDSIDVSRKLTNRTKAVIPVHYGGSPADIMMLRKRIGNKNCYILEDAAEALGSKHHSKMIGSLGDAAIFSFTPTKNITTGEGGIITTDNKEIADRLRLLKNHGQDKKYHHILCGYNYRATEVQAAIGIEQLNKIETIIEAKRTTAGILSRKLSRIDDIILPKEMKGARNTYMMYTLLLKSPEKRNILQKSLTERGIETRVYFPPVHKQPVFSKSSLKGLPLPITEWVSERCLTIPCHAYMSKRDIDFLVKSIKEVLYHECNQESDLGKRKNKMRNNRSYEYSLSS